MIERGTVSTLTIIVVILCTPTTIALSLFHMTNDSSFRPFSGVTVEEATSLVPIDGGPVVVARIGWPDNVDDDPREFAMRVKRTFQAKGVPAIVEMTTTSGGGHITYVLDSNSIGPYSLQNAAAGIKATVSAYRIHPFSRSRENQLN